MILKTIFIFVATLSRHLGTAGAEAAPLAAAQEYVMGTIGDVRIYRMADPAQARAAVEAAMAEIRELDHLMAVQRPTSDVSRLNREGSTRPVRVDPRVIAVLEASLGISRMTGGAFDVTVLPAVQAWGFIDGTPHWPSAAATRRIAGYGTVRIDAAAGAVSFADPATAVDLGGIGKGYALDRARDVLRARGVECAWLDLGGNVATVGLNPAGDRWRVGIRDPRRAGALLGRILVGEASVSTSSDEHQFVDHAGVRYGHVFDPRTGRPARLLVSATVVAASATTADALSTAALVLGRDRAVSVLKQAGVDHVIAGRRDGPSLRIDASPGVAFEMAPRIVPSRVGKQPGYEEAL